MHQLKSSLGLRSRSSMEPLDSSARKNPHRSSTGRAAGASLVVVRESHGGPSGSTGTLCRPGQDLAAPIKAGIGSTAPPTRTDIDRHGEWRNTIPRNASRREQPARCGSVVEENTLIHEIASLRFAVLRVSHPCVPLHRWCRVDASLHPSLPRLSRPQSRLLDPGFPGVTSLHTFPCYCAACTPDCCWRC